MDKRDQTEWPAFCCAIIRDCDGRYLLEQRPSVASGASGASGALGQLTCFGGSREKISPVDHSREETPGECLVRELQEELGYGVDESMASLSVRLLYTGERFDYSHRRVISPGDVLAWFYRVEAPASDRVLITEPGYSAVWITESEMASARVSRWHVAALDADRRGEKTACVDFRY